MLQNGEKALSQHSVDRNGDLYPTHGFGPVAQMLNINSGNQCDYLTSTASKSRGLHEYVLIKEEKNIQMLMLSLN